jgi:GTP-binding protein
VPLLDAMINAIPGPEVEPDKPFQMQITNFLYDQFVGRVGIGRIRRGTLKARDQVAVIKRDGGVQRCRQTGTGFRRLEPRGRAPGARR